MLRRNMHAMLAQLLGTRPTADAFTSARPPTRSNAIVE